MITRRWAIASPKNSNGSSVTEYAVLIIIILTALYWMKGPIARTFYGRWKTAGDSFAFGRQYDPQRTVECAYYASPDGASKVWYDERCFDNRRGVCVTAVDVAMCEAAVIQGCSGNCPQGTEDNLLCSDGIQDQGETGVDCGGPCSKACPP